MKHERVIIIAEAGVNHNGDLSTAKSLVDVAQEAGADYVKFQLFRADKLVSPAAKKASYQNRNSDGKEDSQYQMLQHLELSEQAHEELSAYCKKRGIGFLSSPFDLDSIQFLDNLNIELFKVPSGEITHYPYLREIARTEKPVLLSTGVSTLEEIQQAVRVLTEYGTPRGSITILHCNTEYPTPMQDVNLNAMNTIARELNAPVGYSDHTLGFEVPVAAVALGAVVIEKHFTLDRTLPGPDHAASLEPEELAAMVAAIRNVEQALSGDGIKQPSPSELPNRVVIRRSIHTARTLQKGETVSESDLVMLRPGEGISPMKLDEVIGRVVKSTVESGRMIQWSDLT